MTTVRFGNHDQKKAEVAYGSASPRPLTGSDRPLALDPDPGRWPHPSVLSFDEAAQVGMAQAWVRETLGAELGSWYGAECRRLTGEHERIVRDAAQEGRGRVVMSSPALQKRQQARHHADAWANLLNVDVDGVQEMRNLVGG